MDAADRVAQELREDEQRKRDAETIVRRDFGQQALSEDSPALVYKTHEEPAAAAEKTWWQWTQEHVDYELEVLREALGQALGMKAREVRDDLLREINFLKRELVVLREEVAVERKLKSLQSEIATAQADIPRLPTVEARFATELERLKRELATAQDKISTLNAEASQTRYVLSELEKRPQPTTIDPETLAKWRQCVEAWIKEHEPDPPVLLLPSGHTLPLEQANGAAS